MATTATASTSLSRKEVERIKAPFELDLIAFYAILEDEVQRVIEQGLKEGLIPGEIVSRVEALFEGESDGQEQA